MARSRSLLNSVVVGYDEIEPCIIAALALRENLFLIGPHGNGKTTLGKILGRAADETGEGFRHYSCDKAGLVDLGGLPDMEATAKKGSMAFAPSKRSLFGSSVILADEMPRADKQRQNYWLEVLEEGTFQGVRTGHQMVIATGNDSTYHGNFKFDAALMSRFLFVLPAPDFSGVETETVQEMVRVNCGGRRDQEDVSTDVREMINHMRPRIEAMLGNGALVEQLGSFIGAFTQFLNEKVQMDRDLASNPEAYFSPREFAHHLVYGIIGLTAYFEEMDVPQPLRRAGQLAIKYVVERRHAAAGDGFINICNAAWRQLEGMLTGDIDTPAGQLRWQFASAISPAQKIGFWRQRYDEVCTHWEPNEVSDMAGETLQQINAESPGQVGPFWAVMKKSQVTAHVADQVRGSMIAAVARKLLHGRADNSSPEAVLWSKYASATELTPGQAAEVIGTGTN